MTALDPDDDKLVVLARATRARLGSASGAAVRDETGRTYAAAEVALPSLALSALEAAVAVAAASGATRLEAAAVVGAPPPADVSVLADLDTELLVVAAPDGAVIDVRTAPFRAHRS